MKIKRMLDCSASDLSRMGREELIQSIRASEGRTLLVELRESGDSFLSGVTNSELARAAGADLILLNKLDIFQPHVGALDQDDHPIQTLKQLVKRPLGINLEPVAGAQDQLLEKLEQLPLGRQCNESTLNKANELGLDFICLTGNPKSGVNNQAILEGIRLARQHFKGIIMAGKMHSAAYDEPISSQEWASGFIDAGADVILLPAVGTIPGYQMEEFVATCQLIHQKGALCMATNGTSQDCSQKEVVVQIGLNGKIGGADILHLGSSGIGGLAPFENIFALSVAIRGLNHTLRRMAISDQR